MRFFGAAMLLALTGVAEAGTYCSEPNLKENEVVVFKGFDANCSFSGFSDNYIRYETQYIHQVPMNANGERAVCAGWRIPSGYTVKRRDSILDCGGGRTGDLVQATEMLVVNAHPVGKAIAASIPMNGSYYGTASLYDPDGDTLQYSVVSHHGGATVQLDAVTGVFNYVAPPNVELNDVLVIAARDGKGGYGTYDVYLKIGAPSTANRPPVVTEYTAELISGLRMAVDLWATDPDGDAVSLKLDPARMPQHGMIQHNPVPANPNLYLYTSHAGYVGTDYVHVIATDSRGAVSTGVITLQIISADRDGDGIPSWDENFWGLNPYDSSDAALDMDGDGLSNLLEYQLKTKLNLADSDGDGMPDGFEHQAGLKPLDSTDASADRDGDGYSNLSEYQAGTNLNDSEYYPGHFPAKLLVPVISLLLL